MNLFFWERSYQLLHRLSMLKLHIDVSLVNSKLQRMLPSLVTPKNLTILLKLLLICEPEAKIHVIKILDGLRRN